MADKTFLLPGIKSPIIQAPMAGVSTPALAAAVSNAGALGSLGVAAVSTASARQMIEQTMALTDKPFNVNVFCHQRTPQDHEKEQAWLAYLKPLFDEFGATPPAQLHEIYDTFVDNRPMLDLLLALKPAFVSFHFGLPSGAYIRALKEAGITLLASATTLEEALQIEAAGIDFIVAQGYEAGGHRGVFDPDMGDACMGTLALVRLLVKHCRLPVIAAGGIMDGSGIRAVLKLGACAAQMGTAFVLCPESSANAAYRANLKSERALHTAVTTVISGRAARGIVNRMMTSLEEVGAPATPGYPMTYDAGKALIAAANAKGDFEFSAQWAGQAAYLAREMSAGQLVKTLVEELQ
ncbi:NAD(P)H-dependent flavin oxidoreductase [Advenella sp. RU8]|uniref:NAD(P)H-dependent flavin oxidoreductase n=1 Tax=Advenella sp. RU8 TaxID=3399575 RepID=UPI003AADF1D8